jgi:rhodanese-related sulfurtransferase
MRMILKRRVSVGLLVFLCFTINLPSYSQVTSKSFNILLKSMLKKTVPVISVQELIPQLNQVVLLDAREKEEFEVSHIKNAKHIGFNDFDIENLAYLPKDTPIVIYCSIGVRSEKIGERLKKEGFSNLKNLYGSIFEWVNQGQTVYDMNNMPTKKIHAYNKKWGVWLNKGEKVY